MCFDGVSIAVGIDHTDVENIERGIVSVYASL